MPTSTYVALATVTLASTDTEIVFSSIPADYRDLIVVTNASTTSGVGDFITLQFNSNATGYSRVYMFGSGSGSGTSSTASNLELELNQAIAAKIIQIMDYSATDKHKTVLIRDDMAGLRTWAQAGRWANTAAISTVKLTSGTAAFTIGSTFSLYGIEA